MFSDVFLSEQASTAIRILKTQNKQATEYTEKWFQVSNNAKHVDETFVRRSKTYFESTLRCCSSDVL
jgi:hypothetical protein